MLEDGLVSFNGDRDRLLCDSSFQSTLCLVNIRVRSHTTDWDSHCCSFFRVRAGHTCAFIGVGILTHVRLILQCSDAILGYPIKGLIHDAALATMATLVTSQDVLHGKIHHIPASYKHRTLQSTNGGKGPARTASALTLDFSNAPLGHPVDTIRLRKSL